MKEHETFSVLQEDQYIPPEAPAIINKLDKKKDPVIEFWKTQVVVCFLALLAVGAFRLVGGDIYNVVREKYISLFCDTTSVEDITNPQEEPFESPTTIATTEPVTPTAIAVMDSNLGDSIDDSLAIKENALLLTANTTPQNQMVVPVQGEITSPFGYRVHPVYGTRLFHNGVDIGASTGTPIVAALNGVVEKAEYSDGYGYYVIVNHGKDFKTVYAHCSKLLVTVGQQVTGGETIAKVGSTGVSTGPHLHFEVRRGEYKVNPAWLVNLA